jgi:hypothetical protein
MVSRVCACEGSGISSGVIMCCEMFIGVCPLKVVRKRKLCNHDLGFLKWLKGIWGEIERKGFDCSKNKGVLEINDGFREEDERMKGLMWNECLREIQYRNSFFFLYRNIWVFILDIILIWIKTKIDRHSLIFFWFFFKKYIIFIFIINRILMY